MCTHQKYLYCRFAVESKHGAFFTGGNIEWRDNILYCQTASNVALLNMENGLVESEIGENNSDDPDIIQTFTVCDNKIASSHKSGLIKLWNKQGELEKNWKYIHKGPIATLKIKDNMLASGGSDGVIRIWDLQNNACVLSLKGCQGVINVVDFHPNKNKILCSGDDGKINCYNLEDGALCSVFDAHYSKVTSIVFSHDSKQFVSCARDKVIILWQFATNESLKTIPMYEAVEVIVGLPTKFKVPGFKSNPDHFYVASGGEKGKIRIWDVQNAKEVFSQTNSIITPAEEGGVAITNLICDYETKKLGIVTVDHNVIIHHLKSFACVNQFVGFSDEILDITFIGEGDSHLAVATNSSDIKLYDNTTMSCQLLKGHTDIVLALNTNKINPNLMLSSSKDNSVCLWKLDDSLMTCLCVGKQHTGSVGSVSFSQTSTKFAVSAAQDGCLKFWNISINKTESNLSCFYTEIAHQKDINCVTVAPNDKLIATASQDKTAKLWSESLGLLGVLRGHKRGVWFIRFSPVDQVVATSSADCTIKLWSVVNLNCLKTFEGHDASILRIEFVSAGYQIISAGADGLLKLFSIKTSEVVCALDQHDARIWALAIKRDESGIVTGGGDSYLVKWKDVTEEMRQKKIKEDEERILQEQQLSNYLQNQDYLKALTLALQLEKPLQVLKILQNIIKKHDGGLTDTIACLRNDQKESLLKAAISWNMNSKHCQPAQLVLNILLNEYHTGAFKPVELSSSLEGALPFTERHFKRLTQMLQDLHFINYTINCMHPHTKTVKLL